MSARDDILASPPWRALTAACEAMADADVRQDYTAAEAAGEQVAALVAAIRPHAEAAGLELVQVYADQWVLRTPEEQAAASTASDAAHAEADARRATHLTYVRSLPVVGHTDDGVALHGEQVVSADSGDPDFTYASPPSPGGAYTTTTVRYRADTGEQL